MAAKATWKLPLKLQTSSCVQPICLRVKSQPQWLTRLPKTYPRRTSSRAFATSALLKEKKYTESHEWIELSEDGKTGTVGISTYAAKQLGDVVFVELPVLDIDVNLGDNIGAVESVKSVSDINTPVTGKIIAANELLQEKPATINKSPEEAGWIGRIEVGEGVKGEVDALMGKETYDAFTAEE